MLIINVAAPEAFHQLKLQKKILSRVITLAMKVNIKRARGARVPTTVRLLRFLLTLHISRHSISIINLRLDGIKTHKSCWTEHSVLCVTLPLHSLQTNTLPVYLIIIWRSTKKQKNLFFSSLKHSRSMSSCCTVFLFLSFSSFNCNIVSILFCFTVFWSFPRSRINQPTWLEYFVIDCRCIESLA